MVLCCDNLRIDCPRLCCLMHARSHHLPLRLHLLPLPAAETQPHTPPQVHGHIHERVAGGADVGKKGLGQAANMDGQGQAGQA